MERAFMHGNLPFMVPYGDLQERTLYPLARNKILIGPRGSQSNLLYKGLITDDQVGILSTRG